MDTTSKPLIIGITGPFGSGKTTAASFFEKKGFKKIVLSAFLESELRSKGVKITRKNLQDLGNRLRNERGSGVLAEQASSFITKSNINRVVIDGIRNLGEVSFLRKNFNFVLLGIIADRNVRFERVRQLENREKLTRELFDQLDYRDLGISEDISTGLQVAKCLAVSDHFIDSNMGFEQFEKDLEKFHKKL